MDVISAINGIAVGIYGMVLSAVFCDIYWTKKKQILMVFSMAVTLMFQGIIMYYFDSATVRYLYPLITHIPLMLILSYFCKKRFWAVVAVLTAYLCCQLRRWLALLIVAVCAGGSTMQDIVELMITIPLLLFLLKAIAPSVRSISYSTTWVQYQFSVIPAIYYIFDYLTQIYTNQLSEGSPVIAEFMSFVCSVAYLIFVLYASREKWIQSQMEQVQDSLRVQVSKAVREIETLRESQQKTREYRHDLRHHMQYLSSCIENGQLQRAQTYIQEICSEIEANKVIIFCENEAANLILSAFAERAKEYSVPMQIKAQIPKQLHVSECDLCVLLSNALENALHACQMMKEKGTIEVSAFMKNKKLFLEIKNSCNPGVVFVHGIPTTGQPGHGIGVRSICALVERYEGIYTFAEEAGQFILRVCL